LFDREQLLVSTQALAQSLLLELLRARMQRNHFVGNLLRDMSFLICFPGRVPALAFAGLQCNDEVLGGIGSLKCERSCHFRSRRTAERISNEALDRSVGPRLDRLLAEFLSKLLRLLAKFPLRFDVDRAKHLVKQFAGELALRIQRRNRRRITRFETVNQRPQTRGLLPV
jgi:hypothetical protein